MAVAHTLWLPPLEHAVVGRACANLAAWREVWHVLQFGDFPPLYGLK